MHGQDGVEIEEKVGRELKMWETCEPANPLSISPQDIRPPVDADKGGERDRKVFQAL
jgi:hypothetical protein